MVVISGVTTAVAESLLFALSEKFKIFAVADIRDGVCEISTGQELGAADARAVESWARGFDEGFRRGRGR